MGFAFCFDMVKCSERGHTSSDNGNNVRRVHGVRSKGLLCGKWMLVHSKSCRIDFSELVDTEYGYFVSNLMHSILRAGFSTNSL